MSVSQRKAFEKYIQRLLSLALSLDKPKKRDNGSLDVVDYRVFFL